MMKKIIALILALVMPFTFAACAANAPADNGGENAPADDAAGNVPADGGAENAPADEPTPEPEPEPEPEPVSPFADKAWYADGELTILGIGNSYTDDTLANMYHAAKCAGVENVKVCYALVGGCTLQRHMTYILQNTPIYGFYESDDGVNYSYTEGHSLLDVAGRYKWDFVSINNSAYATGQASTYGVLNMLLDKIREAVGDEPTLVWNMTWAYQSDTDREDFADYNRNQMEMYNSIIAATKQCIVPNERFSYIVPSGTAIQNARTSVYGDTLTRDAVHLSYGEGRYIASLTFLCTILELDPDEVDFHLDGIDPEDEVICKEAVKNALANPFEVTQSEITE